MGLSERIKAARENASLSQAQLAKACGVSRASVSAWEAGTVKNLKNEHLFTLSRLTGYSPEWIVTGLDVSASDQEAPRKAPLVAWHKVTHPLSTIDAEEWHEVPIGTGSAAFWLRVANDTMASLAGESIPEGYLILVDPSVAPENSRLVVAKPADCNEAIFKKLVIDGSRRFLKPLNPGYPLIEIDTNCHVVGVVVEARQQF